MEEIFQVEYKDMDEAKEVQLITHKLGHYECSKYKSYTLLQLLSVLTFNETNDILITISCEPVSLFHIRYECLQLTKYADEDYLSYASRASLQAECLNLMRRQMFNQNVNYLFLDSSYEQILSNVDLLVNDVQIRLQLDTATDITLISKKTWDQIGCPPFLSTKHTALNASGDILKHAGMINCFVKIGVHSFAGTSYDLDLIGIDWIDERNRWNVPLGAEYA
ncbi:Gag-Pol polyprotein [Schistosoma japonicum]|uniref:Gag-Pol polyprotein n=1 Tax=Schistosoma japonicum TaxID=6182 RepID=A0A4Z2DAY1_SCHJA|nr:Gag-Pol polyprotein [Schistosoma japonicum]